MPDSPRLSFENQGGLNTVAAPDELKPGSYPFLQNVRKILGGRLTARPPLGSNQLGSPLPAGITSLTRMNDPYLPGYVLVIGAAGIMYVNASQVATGFSSNPLSFLPYGPPNSPQPWCYIADPSLAVTIPAYSAYTGPVTGMVKVRSDGTCYKTGIMEPQAAPGVGVSSGSGPNWVSYRCTYRSSITGATSNPSPESAPQTLPQTSLAATEVAATGGVINSNITVNGAQYEGNATQIRTKGGVSPGTLTDYVIARNFGLSVPSGVTIDGVQAATQWLGQFAGTGVISSVALFFGGNIIGQIKAPGIQNQQSATTAIQGGNSDSWGTVLTPAIVNDSTFGIGFQVTTQESGGSDRSFFNNFSLTVYYTTVSATVTCVGSTDPQVDKNDIYRQTPGLDNFTYVGTVANGGGFTDTLTDLQVAANPQLSFDNYEPFPSIDLPRKGTLTVAADGACTSVSGHVFNVRWLPGTVILIDNGSGSQIAYELYNRPTSATAMKVWSTAIDPVTGFLTITFPPTGTNLAWEITAPTLAQEPSPAIWGPTPDNAGSFYFGLDPLNPGDLVWSMGNNFDSAPDTNRQFVTSASEALQNGTVTSELSTVFSTERFWLIYPNFSDAVATVTGTQGQQWTLVQSAATRGLYMRYAIGALGSMIAWRAKDSVCVSQGGGPEKDISANIYNLFPHGGQAPAPVTIAGQTVFPPDDTRVAAQTITLTPGYIFYNYQDVDGNPRTLCYDMEAKGWTVDAYTPNVNCHAWAVGVVNQILTGCVDGTARAFDSTGAEASTAICSTPCVNAGDARAQKRLGDLFFKSLVTASNPVVLALYANRYATALSGYSPTSLTGTGALASYVIDFTSGDGIDLLDIAAQMSWPVGSGNVLEWWEPSWTQQLPDSINDRPTEWGNAGYPGNKLIRGLVLELDTFNAAKSFGVERSDDNTLRTPGQIPVTVNGQTMLPFSFATPFTAHDLRLIASDGVPWRRSPDADWVTTWIFDPWPEYAPLRSAWSDLGQQGAKYLRGFVVPLDTNGATANFTVVTSDGGSVSFSATTTAAEKTPVAFAFEPPIVAHDVQFQMNSNAAVWDKEIRWDFDPYPELIPEYTPIMEVHGPDNKFVQGVKLIADTANQAVTFQVLFDGGQTGPSFTGTFNGKQTLVFSWTPFEAHDIQIVPQAPARVWYGGIGQGQSEWVFEPFPEKAANWVSELTALGGEGWQTLYYLNIEYSATAAITLAFVVDSGNGSIAPASITLPSTSGVQTKMLFEVTANKWKLLGFSATSSAQFYSFAEGMEAWVRSWEGMRRNVKPFGGPSAPGAAV